MGTNQTPMNDRDHFPEYDHTKTKRENDAIVKEWCDYHYPPVPQVYYMWNPAYGVVKIGTSIDTNRRIEELTRQHPAWADDLFIITEPGSYDLEKARHLQFAASRVGGEFFVITPDLQAHIDQIRAESAARWRSDEEIDAELAAIFGSS